MQVLSSEKLQLQFDADSDGYVISLYDEDTDTKIEHELTAEDVYTIYAQLHQHFRYKNVG